MVANLRIIQRVIFLLNHGSRVVQRLVIAALSKLKLLPAIRNDIGTSSPLHFVQVCLTNNQL